MRDVLSSFFFSWRGDEREDLGEEGYETNGALLMESS